VRAKVGSHAPAAACVSWKRTTDGMGFAASAR
jgi:hypothetical protein